LNARKIAAFAVGPIGSAALGLLIVPFTAWYFPAEDVGRIAMLQVAISFCLLLFSLGLDQAYVREFHESADKAALLKRCVWPGLSLLTLSLLTLLAWPSALSKLLFDLESATASAIVAACLVCAFLGRFIALVVRMEERGLIFSFSQILPKLSVLACLTFFVIGSTQRQLTQLLIANAISLLSVVVVIGWMTRKSWMSATICDTPSRVIPLRQLLHFGSPLILSGVAFWGMISLDRIFLKELSTFESLASYSIAASFAGIAVIIQSIFSTIWAPMIYKKSSDGVDPILIEKMVSTILSVVVVIFATSGLLSWIIKTILPPQYIDVQFILVACLGYPLLYTLSEASGIGLGITRRSRETMIAAVAALVVNGIANFLLIPNFGAQGAASATAISFLALLILRTEMAKRAWINFNTTTLYLMSSTCTALSVATALYGKQLEAPLQICWIVMLAMGINQLRKKLPRFSKSVNR